jgi:hypothetical protein
MTKILLCFASLSFLWVCCGPINAQAKRLEPEVGKLPTEATGFGETEAIAKAQALKDAVKRVTLLMGMQKPPLESFIVDEDYARKLVEPGQRGKDHEDPIFKEPLKQWVMPFRTDNDWWTDVVYHDHEAQRKARADQRHTWTARVMLGLAVLFLAGFGYVRLDEYTQRRYTTWLRVAGLGVATTVAAGWWYVFQSGW